MEPELLEKVLKFRREVNTLLQSKVMSSKFILDTLKHQKIFEAYTESLSDAQAVLDEAIMAVDLKFSQLLDDLYRDV